MVFHAAVDNALCNNDWKTVKALVEANPELADRHRDIGTQRTLLHKATIGGSLYYIRWLIEERGCNIAVRDYQGWPVLKYATYQGRADFVPVVEYLFERRAPEDANHLMELLNEQYTAWEQHLELFTCVLRCTSSKTLNYIDYRYYTPLASACIKGYAKVARLLLLAGAEAYETYPFGATNAVEWDPGNRNALLKAQAVCRYDSAKVHAAKERCVALIETVPRIGLLRKCRELHGAFTFLKPVMEAGEKMDDDGEKATLLAKARKKLGGMSFLCDRVPRIALPIVEINEEGPNEVVGACVRHVVEGGLVSDAWREVLEMLDV